MMLIPASRRALVFSAIVPHPFDVFSFRPFRNLLTVDIAEFGGMRKSVVPPAHGIREYLDPGARYLFNVPAGLLRCNRRVEGQQRRAVSVGVVNQPGKVLSVVDHLNSFGMMYFVRLVGFRRVDRKSKIELCNSPGK